ncbi:MAG: hypothetical protein OK422_01925 [Thaumarchaeota archaeon]|nr:hypothetical protein [Nitrososphaerota archaeon]
MLRDKESVIKRLGTEIELEREEAELYLKILKDGSIPRSKKNRSVEVLLDRGMVILSGDNEQYIPVHPRLAVANHFRAYRERVVHGLNERRMRVDKLIIELIPVYEATMEKRLSGRGAGAKT